MATNEILPFAQAGGANVLSQVDYNADAQRLIGHQPGAARSELENKALRQASAIAAGIGQWLADKQATNVTDSLTAAQLAAMIVDSIKASSLGYAGIVSYNSAAAMAASDVGKLVLLSGAAGYTLTLLAAASVPAGSRILFRASMSGNALVTLARTGADLILAGNGYDALTGYTVRNGDQVELVSNGTNGWIVARRTNSVVGNLSTGAGWAREPNGMIWQWDQATFAGTTGNITFPIAFPTACVFLNAADWGSTGGFLGVAGGVTTTQASTLTFTSNPSSFVWLALGY